jgi:hypothetical protein
VHYNAAATQEKKGEGGFRTCDKICSTAATANLSSPEYSMDARDDVLDFFFKQMDRCYRPIY